MDLRGCTGVFPQIMLGSMLPLHDARSARRFRTTIQSRRRNRCGCLAVKASSSRDEYKHGAGGPSMVDADMILLRKRIYELKQQENNCESPEEWMEWEKKWPGKYRSSVFQAMECLQFNLISTRPAVGMALLSLVSVSVPASVVPFLMNCATCLMAVIGDGHGYVSVDYRYFDPIRTGVLPIAVLSRSPRKYLYGWYFGSIWPSDFYFHAFSTTYFMEHVELFLLCAGG